MTDERKKRKGSRILWLMGLALVAGLAVASFRVGPAPEIRIEPELPGIGRATPVKAVFEEPGRGLGELRLELVQGDRVEVLAERSHVPRPAWRPWGPKTPREEISVTVGSETVQGLRSGDAVLRATARPAGAWLRQPAPVVEETG